MPLNTERKKHFRTLGHNLKPIVTLAGNGLSEAVQLELDRALEDHELIKVKLAIADRDLRKATIREMCQQAGAELVQEIGRVALVYRAAKKPNPKLSNVN